MAIMSALVYYVLPAMIGRAYDLKNETIGPDLFDVKAVGKARVIQRDMTTSEYSVVTDISEATDFLDINGKLSLKLKIGAANLEGSGSYLKEASNFENKIDLLVRVRYETEYRTLPSYIKPLPKWYESIEGTGFTHYIRSIKYGGELIASISFVTENAHDKNVIRGAIQGSLNTKSGSFGAGLKANLDKIKELTKDTASMNINYYATVPLEEVPRTLEGLTDLVESFPNKTRKINDGKGIPLEMEVFSLEALKKELPTYSQTIAYTDLLTILDEQFTDIKNAKTRLHDWVKTIPPMLPDSESKRIGKFNSMLDNMNKVFCNVIGNLNLSSNAGADQFKPAFDAYKSDKNESIPDMYVKELTNLKKQVRKNTPSVEEDFGGAQFYHWGSDECPKGTLVTLNGTVSSTTRKSIGAAEFACLPEERQYLENEELLSGQDFETLPRIQPVVFVSSSKDAKDGDNRKTVRCASCRIPGKSTVTMIPGDTDCPSNWEVQYKGVLASTAYESIRGQLICLDITEIKDKAPEDPYLAIITEVTPKCSDFPCAKAYNESKAIPCVMCSIVKGKK